MGQFLFTNVSRDRAADKGSGPSLSGSSGRALFTPEDEGLLAGIAARFEALGFEVERDIGSTYDSLWLTPRGSINPSWIIIRQHDGRYQLQDGLLGIERQGPGLGDILPSDWLTPPRP